MENSINSLIYKIRLEIEAKYQSQINFSGPIRDIYNLPEKIKNETVTEADLKSLVRQFVDDTGDFDSDIIYNLQQLATIMKIR